jgi:hypothetical protein
MPNTQRFSRIAGWSLILAAVGFMIAFSYLAARFGYPEVLDGQPADVLPSLLGLGITGRMVWVAYAVLPLLLIPASLGAHELLAPNAPRLMRVARAMGVIAAIAMLIGLMRWPTLQWALAESWTTAATVDRAAIAERFAALNLYLGNLTGELLGEIALNGFFVLIGIAMLREGRRVAGTVGVIAGAIGLVGALRNMTSVVDGVAAIDNFVLPVWLIALGILLIRRASFSPRVVVDSRTKVPRVAVIAASFAIGIGSTAAAQGVAARTSIAAESDVLSFFIGGYSGIVNVSLPNKLLVALGTGRYEVPTFLLEGEKSYDAAKWKATSTSVQVLRVGYRFHGPFRNGPVLGGVILNQNWHLRSEPYAGESRFRPLSVGVTGGYYYHIGAHFYVYPTLAFTHNQVVSGTAAVNGHAYSVAKFAPNGSLHAGWEFGR